MYESMNYYKSIGQDATALKYSIKIKMQKERINTYKKELIG